ncbi:oligosaccharide flippase family protein [Globicatella sulfidifaciens]
MSFINNRRNFIIFFLLKVLIMVLGLITNIFIVRKLTVNDFGVFSVALMFVGLITTFGFSWSSSSILYYGSREKAKTGSINKTFWARNIIIAVSLVLTTILFALFRNQINDYIGLDVALLILIWLYISVAEDYLSQYFLAVKKQLLSSILSITAKVIYIVMIFIFTFDAKTLILLNIVSHATVLFYIFGINKNDIGKFEFDKDWFKEILNFSLWQLFGFSGLYLINFGDTAVIKHFMTTEDVGIYNAAYKLFNSVANFAFVISSYYAGSVSQYFINNESDKIKRFFYKERFFIFGLSTLAHILVMIFSKPIITTLYGDRYIQSVAIFNVLMIGSMFRYLAVFYTLYYNTNNKHKVLQYINIVRSILNLFLDIVFIKLFGLIGPAIATTLSLIITFLFSVYYCEKRILKILNVEDQ